MASKVGSSLLTARQVASLPTGCWATDKGAHGAGVLQVRKLSDGSPVFYYRYTDFNSKRVRIVIGTGIDLAAARRKASELSRQYQDGGGRDLRARLDTQQREQKRLRTDIDTKRAADEAASRSTLAALLSAYIEQLKKDGKTSWNAVQAAFKRHVLDPWSDLCNTPANNVTTEDLVDVLALLTDTGKLREAAKLRSYLMASYKSAIGARQDARASSSLRDLKITQNPARDLVTIKGATQSRERALSVSELRAYWKRICSKPGKDGALLRFHLITGAQRVEQMARVTVDNYDSDLQTILILDVKGRRSSPRRHVVPLIVPAIEAMGEMGHARGPFLSTITDGESGASYSSVERRILEVAEQMAKAGELTKGAFTAGDLRRTVETRLAALGVSKDVRAQLQSHGLSGVQSRHYDMYEYLDEKREALEALYRLIKR